MPKFETTEGTKLLEKLISCSFPNEELDREIHAIVKQCQVHHHSLSCRKKGTYCRFGYPRAISETTRFIETTNELMKNGGRALVLKRKQGEEFITNYNPELLRIWEGNMDIQPCKGLDDVAKYIAKYAAKNKPKFNNKRIREVLRKYSQRRNIHRPPDVQNSNGTVR